MNRADSEGLVRKWRADALLRLKESGARFEVVTFEQVLNAFAQEALGDPVVDPRVATVGADVAIAVLRTSVDNEVGFGVMNQGYARRPEWVGLGKGRKGAGEGRQVVM